MKKGGLKFVFSKKMHKMLKNPLFCDFLEKPSLDFDKTYLFLILEVCSLKRNHFHLVNYFLGSQPILAQCAHGEIVAPKMATDAREILSQIKNE